MKKLKKWKKSDVVELEMTKTGETLIENTVVEHVDGYIKFTKNNLQHIKKHTFEGRLEQSKYLSDTQLESILEKRSFFNRKWTFEQIHKYTEEAYNILRSQGKTGLQSIEIHGDVIIVYIKEDGTFDTAYGIYNYKLEDFR